MPLAFLQTPAGSGKAAFPALAALRCVRSYCASLWFTQRSLDPTAERRSEHSRCGSQASLAQPQAQTALYSKQRSLNQNQRTHLLQKHLLVLYQAKSNLNLCSAWGWSATRKNKTKHTKKTPNKLDTVFVIEKRRLEMPKLQKGQGIKPRKTQDIVVTLYVCGDSGTRKSSWETSNVFQGMMGNRYTGDTSAPMICTQFQ